MQVMETLKPEAAYFAPTDGLRTAYFFFDLAESSGMVAATEPLFMKLNATVQLTPCMNAEDLQKGLQSAGH